MTPRQKFERAATAHTKVLASPFAGVPAGARLHISTPRDLDARIRTIPAGTTLDVAGLRNEMAIAHDADSTCPVTTAIYLRTVIEVAMDDLSTGTPIDDITPFWRVVDPDSALALRVEGAPDVIRSQRQAEGVAND